MVAYMTLPLHHHESMCACVKCEWVPLRTRTRDDGVDSCYVDFDTLKFFHFFVTSVRVRTSESNMYFFCYVYMYICITVNMCACVRVNEWRCESM